MFSNLCAIGSEFPQCSPWDAPSFFYHLPPSLGPLDQLSLSLLSLVKFTLCLVKPYLDQGRGSRLATAAD